MKDNKQNSRFEIITDGLVTFADYRLEKNILTIKYVEAPIELRGAGTAGKLMEEIAKKADAENLKIIPICGYAAVWLRKHKNYHHLLETN
ncbi:MAG: GNAT family N-acetyltransferase [Pseudomonadota bacterium]